MEDFNNLGLFITEKSQYSDCLCTRSVTRIHQNFGGLCVEKLPTPVTNHKNYTPKQILLMKNSELFLLCCCCKFWDCSTSVATTEFSQTLLLLSEFFLSSASCFHLRKTQKKKYQTSKMSAAAFYTDCSCVFLSGLLLRNLPQSNLRISSELPQNFSHFKMNFDGVFILIFPP